MKIPLNKLGWTDVRTKNPVEENIFVFAPVKKLDYLKTHEDLEGFYRSVMEQKLIHAGILNYRRDGINLWWKYSSCGHGFNIRTNFDAFFEPLRNWGAQLQLSCPGCGFTVGSRLTVEEFSQLLLYLMIKNVLPELNMGNIINPSYQQWLISLSREDRDILKTGRHNSEKCKDFPPPLFRPGFLYAIDPDYCNFFSESPEWIKLLFMKYKEQVDQLLQKSFRDIGGPRRK